MSKNYIILIMESYYGRPRSEAFKEVLHMLLEETDRLASIYDGSEEFASFDGSPENAVSNTEMIDAKGVACMYNTTWRVSGNTHVSVETFDYLDRISAPDELYRMQFSWEDDGPDEEYTFCTVYQNDRVVFDTSQKPGGLTVHAVELRGQDGVRLLEPDQNGGGFGGHEIEFSEMDPDFDRARHIFSIEDVARAVLKGAAFLNTAKKG